MAWTQLLAPMYGTRREATPQTWPHKCHGMWHVPPPEYITCSPFTHTQFLKNIFSFKSGVGEMVQQLRVLPDFCLVFLWWFTTTLTLFQGTECPFLVSGYQTCTYIHKSKNIHTHKMKSFRFFLTFLHWISLPWNRVRKLIITFENTRFAGFVGYVCNPSLWKIEIGGSKFEASVGYMVRPCLFRKKKGKKESGFLGPVCSFAFFN